jgi:hypothetical protein
MGDLKKWVDQKWVDIGAPKKDGKYQPCGRKSASGSKRKYPKCVPLAKATRMTSSQKASAVKRKRAAGNPGGKPTNVPTFAKRKKAMAGGYMGSFMKLDVDGKTFGNPSLKKYYKGMV